MKKIIINIDKEKDLYLERINYELGFVKDVIQRIIESHPNDPDVINAPAFKAYQKQGSELQAEYSMATSEIEKQYIPEVLKGHKYNWSIPLDSNEMIVNIFCNCEIEGLEGVIEE